LGPPFFCKDILFETNTYSTNITIDIMALQNQHNIQQAPWGRSERAMSKTPELDRLTQ
jgi:hypothetical protein